MFLCHCRGIPRSHAWEILLETFSRHALGCPPRRLIRKLPEPEPTHGADRWGWTTGPYRSSVRHTLTIHQTQYTSWALINAYLCASFEIPAYFNVIYSLYFNKKKCVRKNCINQPCNFIFDSGQQWRNWAPVIANITRSNRKWFIITASMRTPVGTLLVGGWIGLGGKRGVGGRRLCDKGRVRIKSGFKWGRVKKQLFFFLSQTMPRGVCAPVRAPVCVKKAWARRDLGITSWPISQHSNVRGEDARRLLCPNRAAVTAAD